MTERKFEIGDEVWVKLPVIAVEPDDYEGRAPICVELTSNHGDCDWPDIDRVRTSDDFEDPQDQPIIDAAISLKKLQASKSPSAEVYGWDFLRVMKTLLDAVQAKLDATCPKTARERLQGVIFRNLPTNPRDPIEMPNVVAMLDEAERLGLLNEPES